MSTSQSDVANCSACDCAMDVSMLAPFTNVQCPECGEHDRVKTDVGSYVLRKRQGVGGMSLVFGAVDKTLGREVAIKILNEDYSMDEKRIEQFELEARITAAMSHPHIVKVFTVGQAFNRFFIAMELVSGDSLEKKMSDQGKLSESDVLNWAQQIADGLNAANESGLIHRDIKPGNILFDKDGYVKIVDFGLALVTQGGKAQADEIWATPFYVPPEALDVLEEDFRSDIYALGASLFHALSGEPPFTTETRSTTELKEIKRKLPSLKSKAPWLSDETCEVIDKAMAFDMDDRFSSYQELIDALHYAESVVNHEGEQAPMSSTERAKRRAKEKSHSSWKIPALAGVSVLLVGGILFSVLKGGEEPAASEAPVEVNTDAGNKGSGRISNRVSQEITQARGSLKNRNYIVAARRYREIAGDSNVPIDTVYWAGLQAVTVHWLDGSPGAARKQLRKLKGLSQRQGNSGSETGKRLESAVISLNSSGKIESEVFHALDSELEAMIAFASGLKNWSLGYANDAVELFDKVEVFSSDEPSDEFKFYRSRIADYKHDAALLESLDSSFFPRSMEEVDERLEKLRMVQSKLRTKGRSPFDLVEWNVQCEIHKKRLIREAEEALTLDNSKASQPDELSLVREKITWKEFMDKADPDLSQCRFEKVAKLLEQEEFESEQDGKRAEQLSYLCKNAYRYKASIGRSFNGGNTEATITLKQGGLVVSGITKVNNQGFTVQDGESELLIKWSDVAPGSLVELHKYTVSSTMGELEKNSRLEQAICFAWLTGEVTKAQVGAASLAKADTAFKERWRVCMEVLGE